MSSALFQLRNAVLAGALAIGLAAACSSSTDPAFDGLPPTTTSGGGGAGAEGAGGATSTSSTSGTGGSGGSSASGASSGTGGEGGEPPGPKPDFNLLDVNETSATYDAYVGPHDYLGQVSAWYFGSAL